MAKALLRNFTDQITSNNSKTTDTQIAQAVNRFEDEHSKLTKFKREFDKYTQAILTFDDASHRFFDNVRLLTESTWSKQETLNQACIDLGRIRNEHSQQLHKDINSSINLTFDSFKKMKIRIDEQSRLQHDYDKTRKQYQSILKRDDQQMKMERIRNELDQLKSVLNLLNSELREELPQFQSDLQNRHIKMIAELFSIHGKYYKNSQKLCSRSSKRFESNQSVELNRNDDDESTIGKQSSIVNSDYKIPYQRSSIEARQAQYKVLHQARVIHDYKAENEDEIDLIKNEYISVIAFPNSKEYEHDSGWEYAEKSDGTIGLFPVNFAIRLYENEARS